jgi:hypothetical protein
MASSGSKRGARPGVASAWASVVAGLLGVAAIPVAILASRFSERFELLHAAGAIPVAAVLGLTALGLARRARRRLGWTLARSRHAAARTGRILGLLALCLAISAAIAVGFYRLLVEFQ